MLVLAAILAKLTKKVTGSDQGVTEAKSLWPLEMSWLTATPDAVAVGTHSRNFLLMVVQEGVEQQ